jgi:exopolysaccharide production protein ExoZ
VKLRSIQVLRGVAAAGVLIWHSSSKTLPVGAAGVDLFFVISGFIISKVMVGRSPSDFIADRLWRIFPPYWVAALPWFIFAFVGGAATVPKTLASLTLWPWYGHLAWQYLRPAWTLSFEMLFYAGAAISIVTGRPRLITGTALLLVAANLTGGGSLAQFLGCPLILEFLIGALIGRLRGSTPVAVALIPLAVLALWLSPARLFVEVEGVPALITAQRTLWWGLPAAALVYSALTFERAFAGAWSRLPVFLGDASYSIYLTHFTVLFFTKSMVVCLAVGIAFHLWVERPLLGLRRRVSVDQLTAPATKLEVENDGCRRPR